MQKFKIKNHYFKNKQFLSSCYFLMSNYIFKIKKTIEDRLFLFYFKLENFTGKMRNKKTISFVASFFLLLIPFFSFATEEGVKAPDLLEEPTGGFWGNMFFKGTLTIFYLIFKLIAYIYFFFLKILDFTISGRLFDDVFFSPTSLVVLNTSWAVIRDFFNLFFILIIVFIAISIILGIDKYNDKKLIFRVIMAAVLVNFSKAISLVIIDISQLTMGFFSQAITLVGNNFINVFADKLSMGKVLGGFPFDNSATFFVALLISIIFLFCLTVLIGILAIAMVIRLVAFWVLVILSPMAMFGLSLPGTAIGKLTKKWFEKMVSWAFFGPLMMFFLWLALIVVSTASAAITSGDAGMFGSVSVGVNQKALEQMISEVLKMLIPFIAGAYLLWYGFDQSRTLSQGAASAVIGWGGENMSKWGKTAAKGVGYTAAAPLVAAGAVGAYGANMAAGGSKNPLRLKEDLKARYEGTKNRVKNSKIVKPFTKEEREKDYKNKVARYSGETEELERSVNNEEVKKLEEDKSLTKDDAMSKMNNTRASKESRVAAAMYLSKKGFLNKGKEHSAAEEAMKLTGNNSLKDTFDKNSKDKNSLGRYESNINKQKAIVKKEGVITNEKQIGIEAENRAKSEVKKDIDKKSLDDILKMDKELLEDKEIFDHIKKMGFDLNNAVKKGNKNLTGKKARAIRGNLNLQEDKKTVKNIRTHSDVQRDLRLRNDKEIKKHFPEK